MKCFICVITIWMACWHWRTITWLSNPLLQNHDSLTNDRRIEKKKSINRYLNSPTENNRLKDRRKRYCPRITSHKRIKECKERYMIHILIIIEIYNTNKTQTWVHRTTWCMACVSVHVISSLDPDIVHEQVIVILFQHHVAPEGPITRQIRPSSFTGYGGRQIRLCAGM